MKLPEFSIRNSPFTLVLITLFVLVGIFSLMTMPRSEDPKPDFPNYFITVVYPGYRTGRYGRTGGRCCGRGLKRN